MAEEEAKEEAPAKGGEEKKSNMMMIIVGALLVLLLIIGGILFAMMGDDEEESADNGGADSPAKAKVEVEAKDDKPKIKLKATSNTDYLTVGTIVPAGKYIVNLMSDSGRKYLKTEISLEVVDDSVIPELEAKKPVLQHIITTILTQKTQDDISTRKGKEKLSAQIVFELNEALADGKIKHVFYTSFVIQ